jgi:hypothetical protein
MNLLTIGNQKLGRTIAGFSLPPVDSCPGRTPTCEGCCYARSGRFVLPAVRRLLAWNFEVSRRPSFVADMVEELQRRRIRRLRVHVSGDFYDPEYTWKWIAILRATPQVRSYAYTRSWRSAAILPALEQLTASENFTLWFSCDSDSGLPPRVPPGVRLCWLMTCENELVPKVDLVFRTRPLRKVPSRRVGLTMICPSESGATASTSCSRCGHCWRQ